MISLKKIYETEFEKKRKLIHEKFDAASDYLFQYSMVSGDHALEVYSREDKKIVLRVIYEKIGSFDTFSGVWRWAWATDMIHRRLAESSEKIKKLGGEIMENYQNYNPEEADRYHFYATNGYFFTSQDRIPELVAMAMNRMGSEWFFSIRSGVDDNMNGQPTDDPITVDYVAIKRIIQLA